MTGGLGHSIRRLFIALSLALAGLAASYLLQRSDPAVRVSQLAHSRAYGTLILALLAVGLFASASGIAVPELRRSARVVLLAITFGVAAKALLTGAIMVLAFGSVAYLMLGVAVAQIDPLSVAALLRDSRMSARARSVLSAWASFDDPVTVLLVVYLAALVLPAAARAPSGTLVSIASGSYVTQIAGNAALVAIAAIAWRLTAARPPPSDTAARPAASDTAARPAASDTAAARPAVPRPAIRTAAQCVILVVLIAAAVRFGLLIGITVCGLFYRPAIGAWLDRTVGAAFYAATFLLGMLLLTGTRLLAGLLLGASAFAAQVIAGFVISRGMPRDDRVYLALGQQNGITAIILALALEPYLKSAVGIIAVAILVVNVMHILSNGLLIAPAAAKPGQQAAPLRPGEGERVGAPAPR
jgi:hypothetical protein